VAGSAARAGEPGGQRFASPRVGETGRRGLPAETVLRCALFKQQRQLSYEELAFHLEDSAFRGRGGLMTLKISVEASDIVLACETGETALLTIDPASSKALRSLRP
jgi:hypothetical protein